MVAAVDMGFGSDRKALSDYAEIHHVGADHIGQTAASRMWGLVRPGHSLGTVDVVAVDHRTVVVEDNRLDYIVAAAAGCSPADHMTELEELRSHQDLAGPVDIDCSNCCS